MKKLLRRLVFEEKGGISENTAWIVLILIIAIGVVTALAPRIKNAETTAGTQLDNASGFTY